ncbi:MAG: radical SAM protein, partial [Thermoanaerobaculia bacterium]|nr:radical SAM protein [Thermoanaerobaculia bacterium]
CIIPVTRGAQRSRPADEVVDEVRRLGRGGFSEVVVTGVQISSYKWSGQGLVDLTRRLLEETPVGRLRLSSIAPWQFDHRLLDLFDGPGGDRLCRHFHLSLQSGCDATLRRMRRPYTAAAFAGLAAEIRRRVPGVALTTDLIVGFPGEDEAELEESLAVTRALRFAKIHAFPYSPREGTAAATLPGQVDAAVKKRRMAAALEAARHAEEAFRRASLGTTTTVLWERRSEGRWQGTSDNYLPVATSATGDLERRLTPARLTALEPGGLVAEIAGSVAVA